MLVRRRGPRRIPGPRRPHPCGKDIMTFSLADFMGYCMSVISAIEDLNLSPEDLIIGKSGLMVFVVFLVLLVMMFL